jgi:hypothetical protein
MFDAMTFVLSLIDKRQLVPLWLLTWGNSTLISLTSEIPRISMCFFDFCYCLSSVDARFFGLFVDRLWSSYRFHQKW